MNVDPHPNILARNWAKVYHMLNIYGSAKRSVFYIIHGCYHKLLQERSFCTIVLYHRKYYWLLICMLNPALLKCIYCYLTSCILCGFDLNRLDTWIFLGSKNYANQCPAALGIRVFFSRATGSFVSSASGRQVSRGSLDRNRKPRMRSLCHPG